MFINIWPFSTIRELHDEINYLRNRLDDRAERIARLEKRVETYEIKLAQAQKNDMPRGPNGRFISKVKDLVKDARGVTLIEYGLIAAFIAVALVVVLGTVGDSLNDVFSSINTAIEREE